MPEPADPRYLAAGLAPDPADPIGPLSYHRAQISPTFEGRSDVEEALRTMRQFGEAMAKLRLVLTRPALCFDFDRMGLDVSLVTWDFPTWSVRRRPFDWSTDA